MPLLNPKSLKAAGHFGAIGFEMVALLMVGIYAGRWLDAKYGTEPTFKLAGLAFGIFGGFYQLLRHAFPPKKASETPDSEDESGKSEDA